MTEKEEMEINEPEYVYMVFQYDIDSYYVGAVDRQQLNENSYAFNIQYPSSIYFNDESGCYHLGMLNGIGDSNYMLNLNKSKVISIFSPSESLINLYERKINVLTNENNNDQNESTDRIAIYEVNTKQ